MYYTKNIMEKCAGRGVVRDSLKPRATGIGWRRRDGPTKRKTYTY